MAAELDGRSPALALTSPLGRAADTAQLAGIDAEPDPDLVEWDYGAYEGRRTSEIRSEVPDWTVWTHGVPGGETVNEVEARVDRVLARAVAAEPAGPVVLVGHGHSLRVLAARWISQPGAFGQRLMLDTAALCVLDRKHGAPALRRWNQRPPAP